MESAKKLVLNKLPSPTWSWLKMNSVQVDFPRDFEKAEKIEKLIDETCVSHLEEGIDFKSGKVINSDEYDFAHKISSACGEDFSSIIEKVCSEYSATFTVTGKHKKPIVVSIEYLDDEHDACLQTIVAKENSESSFIFFVNSLDEDEGSCIIKTKVFAEKNAKVHIFCAQILGSGYVLVYDKSCICAEGAEVTFSQIHLGAKDVYSGLHCVLEGDNSSFRSDFAYFCGKNQHLDINHVVPQFGKKTECRMYVNGTLADNAQKTYRGTIDFKNGCAGAFGDEQEQVLLLSPEVKNNSIPVILCDEEDVEGEHGASIGRLGEDVLFYMQSRGISKDAAEKLIAKSKIQVLLNKIEDSSVYEAVEQKMNRIFNENPGL